MRIRTQCHGHRCPRSTCSLATPAPSDDQLFLGVRTIQLLVVHNHAFAFQQNTDPTITEPTPLAGNRPHLFANFRIVRRMISPNSLRIDTSAVGLPASCYLITPPLGIMLRITLPGSE